MPTCSHRRTVALHLRIAVLSLVVLLASGTPVSAQVDTLQECHAGLGTDATLADPTWRTVVDVGHAFALRLPPGHVLSGTGGTWYVHGVLDGAPLVPDVMITFLAGVTIDAIVAHDFPAGAMVASIRMGPATTGARVDATYAASDGTAYSQTSYLAETDHGVLRVDRYEGFDWDAFDAVACSVHVVEVVE